MILTCYLNGDVAWASLEPLDAILPPPCGPFTYSLERKKS